MPLWLYLLLAYVCTQHWVFAGCVLAAVMALYYALRLPVPSGQNEALRQFMSGKIVAHRGGDVDTPENTISSIRRSAEYGACGVEIDTQLTADDAVIIMHDSTVDRTTNGSGRVRDFTLNQIRELNAGAKHKDAAFFRNEHVPTMEEAVLEAQKHKLGVFLDLKNCHNVSVLVAAVVALVRKHNLYHSVVVCSFYPQILYAIRRTDPDIQTGLTYIEYALTREEDGTLRSGRFIHSVTYALDRIHRWATHSWLPRFLGVSFMLLHKDGVCVQTAVSWGRAFERSGYPLPIAVWTVNSPIEKHYFAAARIPFMTDSVPDGGAGLINVQNPNQLHSDV